MKKQNFILFVFFVISWIAPGLVKATHIIGGEITYKCTGVGSSPNTRNYLFTCTMYRDCASGGANYDDPAIFGLYSGSGTTYKWLQTYYINRNPVISIPPPDDPCIQPPQGLCVQSTTYEFEINDLPVISENYFISYTRCCRNETVQNVISNKTGATFSVEITPEAQVSMNNSPVFKSFPPTVICIDYPLNFDHSAIDAEGDSLVYEFCNPVAGGGDAGSGGPGNPTDCNGVTPNPRNCPPPYPLVDFKVPIYNASSPMGGNPVISINSKTGVITGLPNIQGQFIIAVCVSEYRNGTLLSRIRRDFQFNVATCITTVTAGIDLPKDPQDTMYKLVLCGLDSVKFFNKSSSTKIKKFKWIVDYEGTKQIYNEEDLTYNFRDTGLYHFLMIVNENLYCSDTAYVDARVWPEVHADFNLQYDTCKYEPVIFKDKSTYLDNNIKNWNWIFGDGATSSEQNPAHQFIEPGEKYIRLTVEDKNKCRDSIVHQLSFYPVPPVIVIDPTKQVGCAPANIHLKNLSYPLDSTYTIVWDFGDSTTGSGISPDHIYKNPGVYSPSMSIVSKIGCKSESKFDSLIAISEPPKALFSYSPGSFDNFNKTISLDNQSVNANRYQWIFENISNSFAKNPSYVFQDTGLRLVRLIAYHVNGCADTLDQYIDVVPKITFYMPNAFTPNNDGDNQEFKGKGYLEGLKNYSMSIWDRWGGKVFESNEPGKGWNGRKNNEGELLPMGVYNYRIELAGPRGEKSSYQGVTTLIR